MINPEVYNDEALMSDWYNYRYHNVMSHSLYHIMTSIQKDMVGIDEGVKAMVIHNWCSMMDENLKVALAREKGRLAGEKVSNALITGTKTVVKWIKRALVTGVLLVVGAVVFNHWYDGYKELKSTQAVYQLEDKADNRVYLVERLDKSYEYVIVPGHKPNR